MAIEIWFLQSLKNMMVINVNSGLIWFCGRERLLQHIIFFCFEFFLDGGRYNSVV